MLCRMSYDTYISCVRVCTAVERQASDVVASWRAQPSKAKLPSGMARAWYGTAVRTHEHNINTTAYLIQPPSPGFRVTLISGNFFGAVKYTDRYFDTLRLDLRLVRALAESGCISLQ